MRREFSISKINIGKHRLLLLRNPQSKLKTKTKRCLNMSKKERNVQILKVKRD